MRQGTGIPGHPGRGQDSGFFRARIHIERRTGGFAENPEKVEELRELDARIEDPTLWDKPEEAQKLMQKKTSLERAINGFNKSLW